MNQRLQSQFAACTSDTDRVEYRCPYIWDKLAPDFFLELRSSLLGRVKSMQIAVLWSNKFCITAS